MKAEVVELEFEGFGKLVGVRVGDVTLVNLTPHDLTLINGDNKLVVPKSGLVARVATRSVRVGEIAGFPVVKTEFGEVEGLPEPRPNVVFVTSMLVAQAVRDRNDVVAPDTSPSGAIRDSEGKIVGVRGFQKF